MRIVATLALTTLIACGGSEPAEGPGPEGASTAPSADMGGEADEPTEADQATDAGEADAGADEGDAETAAGEGEAEGDEGSAELASMSEEEQMEFLMEKGEDVYKTGGSSGVACITCHQENGKGVPGAFPPLVGQQEHMGDCTTHAGLVVDGMQGEITVDGVTYNGVMPAQANLTDLEIAAVITYERNSWGNDYGLCLPASVKAARK